MAIDKKAYKADKKEYKSINKDNKKSQKSYKKNVKSQTKITKKANKAEEKKQQKNPGSMRTFYDFAVMKPRIKDSGVKPKRSDYKKESAKQERKNLIKYNPVVDKSDDNENIGRGGKGPKPMSRTGRAKASVMQLKDGLVSRFQGSTPKIGKNKLMEPVIEALTPTMVKTKSAPVKKKVETKLTKGQKRSYDLRDAHS